MRKVIKISGHILSALILAVIVLPLALALAIQLPVFQNLAVRKAGDWASGRLQARVSIERIDIKFFSRVSVKGFYVEDYGRDTLLYVERVDAGIINTGILAGRLTLSDAKISGVRFRMHEDEDGTSNFRKILGKIKRKNRPEDKPPFQIAINSLTVEDMYYRFVRLEKVDRGGAVNFSDLEVERFDMQASSVVIIGDSVRIDIDRSSLREKSGLEIPLFAARVENLSGSGLDVRELRLRSGASDLDLESVSFTTEDWQSYKNFVEEVTMEARINPSTVAMATIAAFAPGAAGIDYTFNDLRGRLWGRVSELEGSIPAVSLYGTNLSFNFGVRGLPDFRTSRFDLRVNPVTVPAGDIERIIAGTGVEPLSPRVSSMLDGLGRVWFDGEFHGDLGAFSARGDLEADETRARFDLWVRPSPQNGQLNLMSGSVEAYGLNAGVLSGVEKLGRVALRASIDGSYDARSFNARTDASLLLAEFNGYRYRNIDIDGEFDNKRFTGHVASDDRNIDFDFDGMVDLNDSIPRYDFDLKLRRADLVALNFNRRDSVSVLKADVKAMARGTNPDDLNGVITISDLTYINDEDSVWTQTMRLLGRNSPGSKYLSFTSHFADAEYRSRTSYGQLWREIKYTLESYLPTLATSYEQRGRAVITTVGGLSPGDYSLLSVNIKQANRAVGAFVPGLILASGSKLLFTFNPEAGQLSLQADSEYIEYGNNFLSNMELTTRSEGDSLSVFLRAEDMYAGGVFMPDFSIVGGVKDNRINATAGFEDSIRRMKAHFGVTSTLSRQPETDMLQARLRFSPSSLRLEDRVWNIYSRGILIDSSRVEINDFTVVGAGQNLTVDGVMSRERTDTLHVNLSNFDLEPLTNLTDRLGYTVGGRINGHADLMAARQDAILHARIDLDSVTLNGRGVPDSRFRSTWDFLEERAAFVLTHKEKGDTVVRGYYRPSTNEYLGFVDMKGIELSFIEPFFKGILRSTDGVADVEARLTGQRRQLKVNGQANVHRITTTVDYLNVPYELRDVVARVDDNIITMNGVPLYDPLGNSAMLDMRVDLNNTQNIHYNINIAPQNLLALDTDQNYNDMFYGRVFASGTVAVQGDRRGVNLDITATTADNSQFYMPLGDYGSAVTDIITFRKKEPESAEEPSDYRRRMMNITQRRRRAARVEGESNVNIRMTLDVRDNLLFTLLIDPRSGDYLRARGSGVLSLNLNPTADEFRMTGAYDIQQGSYQFSLQGIINKRFDIEQGSRITWYNDPLDARLDVSAVYGLRASLTPLLTNYIDQRSFQTVQVDCRIMLDGNLTEPEVTFDVEVHNVDQEIRSIIDNELATEESVSTQFLSLLALNSFYSSNNGNIGSAGGSATAFDFLSSQLSNIISNDNFNIGIRYHTRSELTSDEVMLDFSTQLFGNRLLLDVEGNYNAQNTPNLGNSNANNITGDFSLTWLIDKQGNLRLKGFSRTIDRFDENQGLQESGLGIYYKEDFNTVGDIVRNFRERFSRKDKKNRRKEREVVEALEEIIDQGQPGVIVVPDTNEDEFR